MSNRRGKLIIISGFSGVGKGTVIGELMKQHPEFVFSVSATTRKPRPGEKHGEQYFFLSREEFEGRIQEGGFLEYAQYSGNYYGTPADYVSARLDEGKHVILDIECQGAFQVKEKVPEAMMLFLIAPSADVLYRRLKNRGTETDEQIRTRMTQTLREIDAVPEYDVVLVNDVLNETVSTVWQLVNDPEAGITVTQENKKKLGEMKQALGELLGNI